MKNLLVTVAVVVAFGTLTGPAFAKDPLPGGDGQDERVRPSASVLTIQSFSAIPGRQLLHGTIGNNSTTALEAAYTFSRLVDRNWNTIASGTTSVPAGQTVAVTAQLAVGTSESRFRLVITDATGQVSDTRFATLSNTPYVVYYRTVGGSRLLLTEERTVDEASQSAAKQRANARADFLKLCGFVTEVESLKDVSQPQGPAPAFLIRLLVKLEQTQSRRFDSLGEAKKFADQIRACDPIHAGGLFDIKVINELEPRRERPRSMRSDLIREKKKSPRIWKD